MTTCVECAWPALCFGQDECSRGHMQPSPDDLQGAQSSASSFPKAWLINQEPFDLAFVRDARESLGNERFAAVGKIEDGAEGEAFVHFRKLYDAGFLVNTAARFNGRLVGYLVAFTWPSALDEDSGLSAANVAFSAAADLTDLRTSLVAASVEALEARG